MVTDPFALKRFPRWHPLRLAYKSAAVGLEWRARRSYGRSTLPRKVWDDLPPLPDVRWDDTAVTPSQMAHLIEAVKRTEFLAGTVVVEVGCHRGETIWCLSGATGRTVVAVDPYLGYGAADAELTAFTERVRGRENVVHLRQTSGEAARGWGFGPAGMVFIDAVHDYVNTSFDIRSWTPRLAPGGILALHDTDDRLFAGTHRAAFELMGLGRFDLVAHPDNLAVFRLR